MSQTVIQLFCKSPIAGKVKTRLIPSLGTKAATSVFQHCLKVNLELVKKSPFDAQVWLRGSPDHIMFAGFSIYPQKGSNLGEKMYNAMSRALKGAYDNVILIGSDCLDMSQESLQKVSAKLQHHDLVFVPAMDGGYVLIAAHKSIDAGLFSPIHWGTPTVLKESLENAMRLGIDTAVLNPLRDIDRPEDLSHYEVFEKYLSPE